jgi:hypothetical protein
MMNLDYLATDTEAQENVLNYLRTHQQGVHVTFTKKDGSERKMLCTLIEGNIPADKRPKTETTTQTVGSAVRVFDKEVSEWRSFRWDSVTKLELA